jgi:FkbM family methyltransferase
VKEFLKSIAPLRAFVRGARGRCLDLRAHYRRWNYEPARQLRRALGNRENLFVVQIGSNDGTTGNPVHQLLSRHPSWRALFVEPVPFLFERLRRNYPDPVRFRFENVAVADAAGTRPFYYVDPAASQSMPDLPRWFQMLGSFERDHVARHLGAALDRFVITVQVQTFPLGAVLKRNHIDRIDVLLIDTEGYDWEILRQLDLQCYQPSVILFEHKHLSPETRADARSFLEQAYNIVDLGEDYLCRRDVTASIV